VKVDQDIGELFRDAFDGFEADVPGSPWGGIEQQLQTKGLQQAAGTSGGAAGSAGAGLGAKLLSLPVVAITSGLIGAGLIYAMVSGDDTTTEEPIAVVETTQSETPTFTEEPAPQVISVINTDEVLARQQPSTQEPTVPEQSSEDPKESVVVATETKADVLAHRQEQRYDASSSVVGQWSRTNYDGSDRSAVVEPNGSTDGEVAETEQPVDVETTTSPQPMEIVSTEGTSDQIAMPAPVAAISADVKGGFAPLTVNFINLIEHEGYAYYWDFDDGESSKTMQSAHTFEEPGLYEVLLEVSNVDGEISTNTVVIEVEPGSVFEHEPVPNVFTPNNDRFNQNFIVPGVYAENITTITFSIHDTQGRVVYRSGSLEEGWDGVNQRNGRPAEVGTYFYVIDATGIDGKVYNRKGYVTLRR